VETIAAHYLEQIRSAQREGGYFLGGYSFGATIAFEIAQQLTQQGGRVDLLLLVDPRYPGSDVDTDVVHPASVELNLRQRLSKLSMSRLLRILHERLIPHAKERIGGLRTWVSNNWKRKVGTVYLALGYRLPISFRTRYMVDVYARARLNYAPKPYAGPVLYIKSEKRDAQHQQRWRA
jgi:pimeloyl-ACP methyl ester carboxylesterase